MHPHRVSWICDSAVRKGIRYEEISEFIMNDWFRDMQNGQKCNPKKQCRESHHGHAKLPFTRQVRHSAFQADEKLRADCWTCEDGDHSDGKQNGLKKEHVLIL